MRQPITAIGRAFAAAILYPKAVREAAEADAILTRARAAGLDPQAVLDEALGRPEPLVEALEICYRRQLRAS